MHSVTEPDWAGALHGLRMPAASLFADLCSWYASVWEKAPVATAVAHVGALALGAVALSEPRALARPAQQQRAAAAGARRLTVGTRTVLWLGALLHTPGGAR